VRLISETRKQEDKLHEKKFTRPNFGPDESEEYQDWAKKHDSSTEADNEDRTLNPNEGVQTADQTSRGYREVGREAE